MEAQSAQRGDQNDRLKQPAQQIGPGQTIDAQLGVQGEEVEDDCPVGHRRHEGRGGEVVLSLEHPHQGEGHAGKEHRREHHPGEGDGQPGGGGVGVVGKEGHQGLGEGHSRQCDGSGKQGDDGEEGAGKAKGLLPALFLQVFAEHRDKAGGNGRGKHRVEKHPWNAAGGKKGVGGGTGAVVDGKQPVPVQAQHLADKGNGHHKADGPGRAAVLFLQSAHPLSKSRIGIFYIMCRFFSTVDSLMFCKQLVFKLGFPGRCQGRRQGNQFSRI